MGPLAVIAAPLAAAVLGVDTAILDRAPGPSTGDVAYVVVGLGSALLVLFGQAVLRRQQKDKLIAEASDEVASGAKTILEEYRKALNESRRELNELRERLVSLELQLGQAQDERDKIRSEHESTLRQLRRMEGVVADLQRQVRILEDVAHARRTAAPSDPPAGLSDP